MENDLTKIVDRNINTLLELRAKEDLKRSLQQQIADMIAEFAGSLGFIYVHFLFFGGWILLNSGWIGGVKPWDPFPLPQLSTIAAIEAIFLATFVLINQNRMSIISEKRADLGLQVALITEHEITRLIHMVENVTKKVGADKIHDVEDIKKDIPPEMVMDRMDEAEIKFNAEKKSE